MTERLTDSLVHDEVRANNIREETARIERERAEIEKNERAHAARREQERRRIEDADVERLGSLLGGIKTRDQLLDYVRATREPPPPPPPPPPLTDRMRAELAAEQEAGRAAVAKAEAQLAHARELQQRFEARAREGAVQPIGPDGPEAA